MPVPNLRERDDCSILVQGNHQTHNHWHISLKASWKENFHAKLETGVNATQRLKKKCDSVGAQIKD